MNKECICIICGKSYIAHSHNSKFCISCTPIKLRKEKHKSVCLWCKSTFTTKYKRNARYCSPEHGLAYRTMLSHIDKKYFFEHEQRNIEIEKLAIEGEKYVLPEGDN